MGVSLPASPVRALIVGAVVLLFARVTRADGPEDGAPASAWWLRSDLADGALDPMWNEGLESAVAGLRLSGTGEGSGAPASAIAARGIQTAGAEIVRDDADGFSATRVADAHATVTRVLAARDTARQAIQRIVRANYGRFRLCYEAGLRRNPRLAGRVVARFVIDSDGSVTVASDGGSDLEDSDVIACVVRGFANLSFPPEAASGASQVAVLYPLVFAAGPPDADPGSSETGAIGGPSAGSGPSTQPQR